MGVEALLAFMTTLEPETGWIDLVETYEVVGDLEIPRLDLGIYGDHGAYGQPAAERLRLAGERVEAMLDAVSRESKGFIFQVWLDSEEYPSRD
ncbi:hypothetical protein KWG63_11475 [Brevundimonas nasdae]|uniref:hypothetical protein n=1 Tax=Brevundimonas nasdae TaxID=172043 RepID=UPI001C5F4379|nr:hypothetical protein [Brevundimonas nasdae]QYC12865.1 hypothetical protein KWG63_11475 [Brevundimonas nasdae]